MSEPKRSPSYRGGLCCRAECELAWRQEDHPEEICWGKVEVAGEVPVGDDEWAWVHACEGHRYCLDGEPYVPEPPSCSQTPSTS
jgi:hypothetical protein